MKKSIGPKVPLLALPVLIVGSYDANFKPNLMACAWGGICCSEPPCVNISVRKSRYSYNNIISHKAFSVNVLFADQSKEADFYGIVSGKGFDKFEKTGITPIKSDLVDAPYGKEFPLVLECKLVHQIDLGSHTEFIGEILDIKVDDNLLQAGDKITESKFNPIFYVPFIKKYFSLGDYSGLILIII